MIFKGLGFSLSVPKYLVVVVVVLFQVWPRMFAFGLFRHGFKNHLLLVPSVARRAQKMNTRALFCGKFLCFLLLHHSLFPLI